MDEFKFVVKEYFILGGNMVDFIGKMLPEGFCIVNSKDYDMKLYSSDKLIHTFNNIGEEMPISYSGNKIKSRALRTFDDIAHLLKKESGDLFILGTKRKQ